MLLPSRPKSWFPEFVSRCVKSTRRSQQASRPAGEPTKDMHPESMSTPSDSNLSNWVDLSQLMVYQQGALSYTDPLFVRTVTVVELVCGKKRYKCLGCLRYYHHLRSLLGHIEQGWTEGFSCRAFYQKLKAMQVQPGEAGGHKTDEPSRRSPGLSETWPSGPPAHAPKENRSREKKIDMICKWLQTIDITTVCE